ncbi:MAG: hypothetical protein V2A73_09070 [Pseudomonadota bacterium]
MLPAVDRQRRTLTSMLAVALFLGGCGGREESSTPAAASHGSATESDDQTSKPNELRVDVAASDAKELRRALFLPYHELARSLGPHRFQSHHELRVLENGKSIEELNEDCSIDYGERTQHASYQNSRGYGREVFHRDDTVWIRPRYGKFHRRPANSPEEPNRLLTETFGTLAADFELVAHAANVVDEGQGTVAGRAIHSIKVSHGASGTKQPETAAQRAWRDTIVVKMLEGRLSLDAQTGMLVEGTLRARLQFLRAGKLLEMELASTHSVKDIGAPFEITPPGEEESVATPLASSELEERDSLLDGLAPPMRMRAKPTRAR